MLSTVFQYRPVLVCAVTLSAFALSGCGATPESESSASAAPEAPSETAPAMAAPEAPAEDSPSTDAAPPEGSEPKSAAEAVIGISGRVTFAGERPKQRPLETEADPACMEMHMDEPLRSDAKVVNADGGVHWVFVYLKDAPKADYPVPEEAAELDQVGCRYVPHVMGMRAGQQLAIKNSDETVHNVRSFSARRFDGKIINKTFNFGQPEPGTRMQVFENPENAIKMKCDIHPWMQGYIFAMDHPYFATTNENGEFTIPTEGLPAGDYTMVAWHEVWGEKTQTVSVGEDGTASANVEFSE